ncbi:sphingolipid C9-methyltransferase 2-like isoform X2 [Cannabis sativa]|uniref:sphingolipid C9-methyltransferase 2-like isoform X2 n=1 Tax=Cannabis sativa TaxID=3483 RepID=UPI0029C9E0E2|nr:sphingolipid C9-methyltransferase 2-like isoform X2 [Cannabis sativa]
MTHLHPYEVNGIIRLPPAAYTLSKVDKEIIFVEHIENIGIHYYQTLKIWRKNFLENQSKIQALGFSDKFIRTWEYYFDYCASGFKSRTIDCVFSSWQCGNLTHPKGGPT